MVGAEDIREQGGLVELLSLCPTPLEKSVPALSETVDGRANDVVAVHPGTQASDLTFGTQAIIEERHRRQSGRWRCVGGFVGTFGIALGRCTWSV